MADETISKNEYYRVVINLDSENDTSVGINFDNFIHKKEFQEILLLMDNTFEKIERLGQPDDCQKIEPEIVRNRYHDTILLEGSRGSGKTTFIYKLLSTINKGKYPGELTFPKKMFDLNKVEVIELLDPTLIEEKAHIFVNIIARIKDKVIKKTMGINCTPNKKLLENYHSWEDSLKKLAAGLPSIDGVANDAVKNQDWLDPEFAMEQGINQVTAANWLEERFHLFVQKSLEILCKKAFLICIDDTDTNFSKGWPVLETIRKYLTTPQIITVLCGDVSLFTVLSRKHQWQQFGKELMEIEVHNDEDFQKYNSMVTHLEEQYLLKILKAERRITLATLQQKLDSGLYKIEVSKSETSTLSLQDHYSEIFSKLGIRDVRIQIDFHQFLTNLPIRSQIQFLKIMSRANFQNGIPAQASDSDATKALIPIFWSDLTNKGIDPAIIRDHSDLLNIHLLQYLLKNDILTQGYSFRPSFSDVNLNGSQFAAGLVFSINTSLKPGLIFEYWLRIGLTREISSLFTPKIKEQQSLPVGPSLENFLSHCSILSKKNSINTTRMVISYIHGICNWNSLDKKTKGKTRLTTSSWLGTLPLNNKQLNLEKELSYLSPPSKIIANLAFSNAIDHRGYRVPILSIHGLVAIFGEILESQDGVQGLSYDKRVKIISNILFKSAQSRDYPLPSWLNSRNSIMANEAEPEDVIAEEDLLGLQNVSALIFSWYNDHPKTPIHPNLLAKSITRFFYILNAIDSKSKDIESDKDGQKQNPATMMHRYIIAFLHSVIIEEYLESTDLYSPAIEIRNPIQTDFILIHNLQKIMEAGNNLNALPLSKWLCACPLWYYFINPKEKKTLYLLGHFAFNRPQTNLDSAVFATLSRLMDSNANRKTQFKIDNPEHVKFFIDYCRQEKLTPNDIMREGEKYLVDKLRDKWKGQYDFRKNNAGAIIRRISSGKLTW